MNKMLWGFILQGPISQAASLCREVITYRVQCGYLMNTQ